ncbi:hypothetical protein LEP1GSC050_3697 [Leptospira broomii serovar Hurstbridge str. 5399]|uniref:Uncharacterized protein n=1 Tax=Leptospira broomii serovar Hurstbridge str. 5399 TaxID=1049789 RepID=T0EYJ4_9LEPT|nr:hypothetical protein LEP1GSC050_3697 [Leptospira broomii serovar Hurstbridge str. 5399]
MTAFVAFIGLLPASLSNGISSDLRHPIAAADGLGNFKFRLFKSISTAGFLFDSWRAN